MKKLNKYFLRYKLNIVIIIILLLLQVFCDLTLPSYTSNIVNIGIQKNGIDSVVPEFISKDNYELILSHSDDKTKRLLDDNYVLIDIKDNKLFKNDVSVYNLQKISKNDKRKLENVFYEFSNVIFSQTNEDKNVDFVLPEIMKNQIINEMIKKDYQNLGLDLSVYQMIFMKRFALKMISIALLGSISYIFLTFFSAKFSSNIAFDLRKDIFSKIMKFSNNEFEKYSTSSLITRATNDVTQIQNFSNSMFRIMIYSPILGIGGIYKLLQSKSNMEYIIIIAIFVIFILMGLIFAIAIPRFKKIQLLIDNMNLIARETLSGMNVIRVFNNQEYQEKKFDEKNNEFYKNNIVANLAVLLGFPIINFIMNIVGVMIVYKGAYSIDQGIIQAGDLIAFTQYALQVIMAFLMVTMIFGMIPRASVSAKRIFEILEEDLSIVNSQNAKKLIEINEIEFKNVNMKFEDNIVLENINFKVKKGEQIGIIGSTGSGKSTILKLIERFFDVNSGEVLINGENIKNYELSSLRSKISYAQQKSIFFTETIKENILNGAINNCEKVTEDKILEITDISNATSFINDKENQLDELVAEGGANFSGGQKQRLSLARTLIKDADVYMLDDTFNALDYKTAANIQIALKDRFKNKISIVVSQRITTIENSDKIIVLDAGKVVGFGTHNELLNICDIYRTIASAQTRR